MTVLGASDDMDVLIGAWLDGVADEAMVAKIDAHLRQDPEAGDRFVRLAKLHHALSQHGELSRAKNRPSVRLARQKSQRKRQRSTLRKRQGRRRSLVMAVGVAGAVAVVVVMAVMVRSMAPSGQYVPSVTPSWLDDRDQPLAVQATMPTNAAPMLLRRSDQPTTARLAPDGVIKIINAQALELTAGRLSVQAAPQATGQRLVVITPHARASVVGTAFEVIVAAEMTQLVVHEGRVRFETHEGTGRLVQAGESATLPQHTALAPVTAADSTLVPTVLGATWLDAENDRHIRPLRDGDEFDLASHPGDLNILIQASGPVGSVKIRLNGERVRRGRVLYENDPPYTLAGDNDKVGFHGWRPPLGSHVLEATPYTEPEGKGVAGETYRVRFTVIDTSDP